MGMTTTVLSFFKSNAEQLIAQDESNIGSYLNGKLKTDIFKTMFSRDVYSYDFNDNKFVADSSFDSKALTNVMNNHVSNDDYELKYHVPNINKKLAFVDYASYWSNPIDVYFNMIDVMYSAGAITVNTYGEILRQCGFLVTLAIDRDMNALRDDSS